MLVELYELELAAYRAVFRRAVRLEGRPSAVAIRALAGHVSTSLDDLRRLAALRRVSLTTPAGLVRDTALAIASELENLLARAGWPTPSRTRTHETLGRALLVAERLEKLAWAEGDVALAAFCGRWSGARSRLLAEASRDDVPPRKAATAPHPC
jgi:hypothetical protein